jgi:hypothetical protein
MKPVIPVRPANATMTPMMTPSISFAKKRISEMSSFDCSPSREKALERRFLDYDIGVDRS